jgi:hypothetical protein
MNTAVVIFAHKDIEPSLTWRWPWYVKSGCDLVGQSAWNVNINWPKDKLIQIIRCGDEGNPYRGTPHYIARLIATMSECLIDPLLSSKDQFCFIEYDGVFVRPLPELTESPLYGKVNGYNSEGFFSSRFIHTPWIFKRDMLPEIIMLGKRMLKLNLTERGFVDRWLGLMLDLYCLDFSDLGRSAYSENTIDKQSMCDKARDHIEDGAFYIHGIKTQETLNHITRGMNL